jgi:hypothetical protein
MDDGCTVAGVYTFGAPRIGCPDFAAGYPPVKHRVERAGDLVCWLPPTEDLLRRLGPLPDWFSGPFTSQLLPLDVVYQHAGRLTLIDSGGTVRSVPEAGEDPFQPEHLVEVICRIATGSWPALLEAHCIEGYVSALLEAEARSSSVNPVAAEDASQGNRKSPFFGRFAMDEQGNRKPSFLGKFTIDRTDRAVVAAIASASTAAAGLGSATVAVITTTSPAWGPLGWLGLTTTAVTTVALPVAGVVAAVGAATWGGYKVYKILRDKGDNG